MATGVVLCSGGMDSVIAYYQAITQFKAVHIITFDYGQRHRAELDCAKRIFKLSKDQGFNPAGIELRVRLSEVMPRVGSLMCHDIPVTKYHDSAPTGDDDPSFIPYRNLLFLAVAAQWARALNANEIITGLRGGFPDCTELFEKAVATALNVADPNYELVISSPVHRSRAESLELALRLPGCWEALSYSMTCFEGTEPPCGECLPCKKRAEGFQTINKPDPLLERLQWKN
jgi:7-cyano-7-deazaguanine synthase